jgi:hypothetical protein
MMGWLRPSRERRGEDRYLNVKVAIFCLGAGIAMVGIASGRRWIVNLAIVVLLVGFLLRFLPKRTQNEAPPTE